MLKNECKCTDNHQYVIYLKTEAVKHNEYIYQHYTLSRGSIYLRISHDKTRDKLNKQIANTHIKS